jgi:hypothetical protein
VRAAPALAPSPGQLALASRSKLALFFGSVPEPPREFVTAPPTNSLLEVRRRVTLETDGENLPVGFARAGLKKVARALGE